MQIWGGQKRQVRTLCMDVLWRNWHFRFRKNPDIWLRILQQDLIRIFVSESTIHCNLNYNCRVDCRSEEFNFRSEEFSLVIGVEAYNCSVCRSQSSLSYSWLHVLAYSQIGDLTQLIAAFVYNYVGITSKNFLRVKRNLWTKSFCWMLRSLFTSLLVLIKCPCSLTRLRQWSRLLGRGFCSSSPKINP